MPLELLRAEDGQRMQVLRPDKPDAAVALALEIQKRNDTEAFRGMPEELRRRGVHYTLVGYLGRGLDGRPVLCDRQGNPTGSILPGDSFVSAALALDLTALA